MKKLFIISLLFISLIYVIDVCYKKDLNNFNYNQNVYIRVKRSETGHIEYVPFENYIVGVVAGEMPVSFDLEALKAQAVASRSYALTKMNQNIKNEYDVVDTVMNQVYIDNDTLKESWGSSYQNNIKKILKAVDETKGQYLTYKGEVINAFFFSTSVGKTENCVEVFGGDLPYLVSVDSKWDEISPVFNYENEYMLSEFYERLGLEYKDYIDIDILKTTETGRIKKLLINGISFEGSEVASKLSLKSTYFKITQDGDEVVIDTKGYGHGVGMSQYGAFGMAKVGYNYEEILKHYYSGVEISKM